MANNNVHKSWENQYLRCVDRSSDYKRCRHKHSSVIRLATSDFNILERIVRKYPICEIAAAINPLWLQIFGVKELSLI